jgi:competence protein ComEA
MLVLATMGRALAAEGQAPVDVNSASAAELKAVKGIGDATATKIISNRPYKSLDDLGKAGLSAKKIEKLRPYLTVGGSAVSAAAPAVPAPVPAAAAKSAASTGSPASPKLAPGQKVSLNSASLAELESLPGIGPKKAQAIVDGRPYKTIEDVMKVKGIKQGTFGKIKDHITVD